MPLKKINYPITILLNFKGKSQIIGIERLMVGAGLLAIKP